MRIAPVATLMAVVLTSSQLGGQSRYYGVRAGFVESRQVDDLGASNPLSGLTLGFSLLEERATWIGWQSGLIYTQKGWRQGTQWIGLDYVEVPVLLRLAIPRNDQDSGLDAGLQPFVMIGPEISVLVRCFRPDNRFRGRPNSGDSQVAAPGGPRPTGRPFPSDCDRYLRPHDDFSWVFGGGLSLRRARQHFTIELRRAVGLADLRTGPRPSDCGSPCRLTNVAKSVSFNVVFKK